MDVANAKAALVAFQTLGVTWSEEGGEHHLWKRIEWGDLPPGTTLEDFDGLIRSVVESGASDVYTDPDESRAGGAVWVVGTGPGGEEWIVKVHADGSIRTAFPPGRPHRVSAGSRQSLYWNRSLGARMDVKLKKKALGLWRELAERPEALDIEAVDALALRDEIEAADLLPDEWQAFQQLDREIALRAADVVRALKRTGALGAIERARAEFGNPQWWWWLDYQAKGNPVPLDRLVPTEPGVIQPAKVSPAYRDAPSLLEAPST